MNRTALALSSGVPGEVAWGLNVMSALSGHAAAPLRLPPPNRDGLRSVPDALAALVDSWSQLAEAPT